VRGSNSGRRALFVAAAVIAAWAAVGTPAAQVATGRVLLATVVDPQGAPIVDLSEDDFSISEDGEPRQVFSVHVADYPLVLLVHDDPTAGSDRASILQSAARFLRRIGQDRPVAVGTLTGSTPPIAEFETERNAVLTQLESRAAARPTATAVFAPLETVAGAAAMLQMLGSPFSSIIVVANLTSASSRTSTGIQQLSPVFDSRAIVHVVSRSAAGETGVSSDGEALRALADQTGGQFTTIYSAASYAVALDRLADRLGAEMMVDFLVPQRERRGRNVEAGVRIPGARVQGLRVSP
jgi:hypothetical protein